MEKKTKNKQIKKNEKKNLTIKRKVSQLLKKKPKTKTIKIKNYSFKNREKASSFNISITSNIYICM